MIDSILQFSAMILSIAGAAEALLQSYEASTILWSCASTVHCVNAMYLRRRSMA